MHKIIVIETKLQRLKKYW